MEPNLFRLSHPDEVVVRDHGFTFYWECRGCGAVVRDTALHEKFHQTQGDFGA